MESVRLGKGIRQSFKRYGVMVSDDERCYREESENDGDVPRGKNWSGQSVEFKVEVRLHQGTALSPFLFTVLMDVLTVEFQDITRGGSYGLLMT